MKITVGELIVRFMERLGIDRVFGMPGAHILPVYDHLRSSKIGSVLVKHEQGAAFMAGGYARASAHSSAKIGACIATAGPGATNLVTGIANAYADRLPVLAITGETSTWIFGRGGLQEGSGQGGAIDLAAIFSGITRTHRRIDGTDFLAQTLHEAAHTLRLPVTGPVVLTLPYDVQKTQVDESLLDGINFSPAPSAVPGSAGEELARMIAQANHPVLVAGEGCIRSGAQAVVARLAEAFRIPVATSINGKGIIDERTPFSIGCLGITSDGRAWQHIVDCADLVIFLGASFNERTSRLWEPELLAGKKVVQVDHDPDRLGRVPKVSNADRAICADVRAVLEAALAALEREGIPGKAGCSAPPSTISPHFKLIEHFFSGLVLRFPRGAQIVDDNIILAQTHFRASPVHRYFPNSGISAIGHAIPAAIGARLARAVPTFAILGDGGFQMCCMEIMTAVNHGIPVNIVLINNGTLGLIRKNQFQLYGGRTIDCDFVNPDYALLARSFGINHFRIETTGDVDRLFADANLEAAINLIEIPWDKNVFPGYKSDR
ncbi:MAG: thiamine pyrophosphate-binding protein [Rhodocyclaceae bacterium]|nr:thiamine pyrophosphate-binding protein [Rhodocyclaceae bacterium]